MTLPPRIFQPYVWVFIEESLQSLEMDESVVSVRPENKRIKGSVSQIDVTKKAISFNQDHLKHEIRVLFSGCLE